MGGPVRFDGRKDRVGRDLSAEMAHLLRLPGVLAERDVAEGDGHRMIALSRGVFPVATPLAGDDGCGVGGTIGVRCQRRMQERPERLLLGLAPLGEVRHPVCLGIQGIAVGRLVRGQERSEGGGGLAGAGQGRAGNAGRLAAIAFAAEPLRAA